MNAIDKIIQSNIFFWLLLLVGSGLYLAADHYLNAWPQELAKFVIFFVVIAGLVRHGQIKKCCNTDK